ncbi:MAG: trypsin-like peptidase domain-containing protein [bacterium]|nr:trypsin-like peptidase domain-containing protein [bacterium]
MKLTFILFSAFFLRFHICEAQNTDSKKIVLQSFVESKVSVFDAENDEFLGDLPLTLEKAKLKNVMVVFKAEQMQDLAIFIPLKDVLEVNVHASVKSKITNAHFKSFEDLPNLKSQVCEVFMLPKMERKSLDPLVLNLMPVENKLKPLTAIGRDQSGLIYKTISEEMAYDPIFGTSKNLRKQLCSFLASNNVHVANCDLVNTANFGPNVNSRKYTSVKPLIVNFTFKIYAFKFKDRIYKYGYYNLKMKYKFELASGKSKEIDLVNYGYCNAVEPNNLFAKAILDNLSIWATDSELLAVMQESNNVYKKEYSQYKLRIRRYKRVAKLEMKDLVKGSSKAVVTIDGAESSFGSGFLINDSGYILTNYHVIEDANPIRVSIGKDTTTFIAELVRYDASYDLALLKINKINTPYLMMKQVNDYEVGDPVIAIGTPASKELGQTVSKGIISGVRKIEFRDLIQTDVSINPGNSGGPLLDENGEVIGIVVMKISGKGYEGLGFAIPAIKAIELMNINYLE